VIQRLSVAFCPRSLRAGGRGRRTSKTSDMKGTFTPTYGVKVPFMRAVEWVPGWVNVDGMWTG
jgi:hypothetical protein